MFVLDFTHYLNVLDFSQMLDRFEMVSLKTGVSSSIDPSVFALKTFQEPVINFKFRLGHFRSCKQWPSGAFIRFQLTSVNHLWLRLAYFSYRTISRVRPLGNAENIYSLVKYAQIYLSDITFKTNRSSVSGI